MSSLNNQVINATKWSVITEVMGKLVAPITSMVLARLLTPEAFGVVATLNMIIAFAEIFTDAGFQQYLIQKRFISDEDLDKDTNVAFWTNLFMSFILWGIITFFAEPLATLVGNPGLGNVLIVACASIPLAAFSSIQMALFKKKLDFKSLFYRRLVSIIIPLVLTIPLAYWMRSYWALVIGTIAVNLANAIILTLKSNWRPRIYYDINRLNKMFAFCSWAIINAILVWSTSYIDIFFVGVMLNEHYLGLYKTSMTTVGHITSLISASIIPVVMPALSKVQHDHEAIKILLLKFQKYAGLILLPLGFGIFSFRYLITTILLGDQWYEATPFIGIWGLMEVIVILFHRFCSNVYPALGKPNISVIAQLLHLVVLVPAVYIAVQYGFTALYWTRSLIRIESIVVNLIFLYYLIGMSPWRMLINILPELFSSIIMALFAYVLLRTNNNLIPSLCWAIVCALVYLVCLSIFPQERILMKRVLIDINKKRKISHYV